MAPASKSPQHVQALLMLLLANFFWGLSFPLIKGISAVHAQLQPESSSWFITASALYPRFVIGTLVLGALCFTAMRTLTRSELRQGLGLGLFAAAGQIFQNDGLQFTAASTSAFLTQFYAILIPIWIALRARRHLPWTVWLSSALVLGGVAVLARLDWHDLRLGRGEIETLICSLFFMGQILWLDRPEFATNRPLPATVVMFAVEAIVALVLAWMVAPADAPFFQPWRSGAWIGFTVVLTVFSTLGSFTIMNTWQPKITATEAGLMYCFEPVFASIMALILPAWLSVWGNFEYSNELVTTSLLVGGGLITAANILIQLKPLAKPGANA